MYIIFFFRFLKIYIHIIIRVRLVVNRKYTEERLCITEELKEMLDI